MEINAVEMLMLIGGGLGITGVINLIIFKFPILGGHNGNIIMTVVGVGIVAVGLYLGGSL